MQRIWIFAFGFLLLNIVLSQTPHPPHPPPFVPPRSPPQLSLPPDKNDNNDNSNNDEMNDDGSDESSKEPSFSPTKASNDSPFAITTSTPTQMATYPPSSLQPVFVSSSSPTPKGEQTPRSIEPTTQQTSSTPSSAPTRDKLATTLPTKNLFSMIPTQSPSPSSQFTSLSPSSSTRFLSQIDYIYASNITYDDFIESQEDAMNIITDALSKLISMYILDTQIVNVQADLISFDSEYNTGDIEFTDNNGDSDENVMKLKVFVTTLGNNANDDILNTIDTIIENGELQSCVRTNCGKSWSNASHTQQRVLVAAEDNNPLSFVVICSQVQLYRDDICMAGSQNSDVREIACAYDKKNWNEVYDSNGAIVWFWFIFGCWCAIFIFLLLSFTCWSFGYENPMLIFTNSQKHQTLLILIIMSFVRIIYYSSLVYGSQKLHLRTCGEMATLLSPTKYLWQNISIVLYALFYTLILLKLADDYLRELDIIRNSSAIYPSSLELSSTKLTFSCFAMCKFLSALSICVSVATSLLAFFSDDPSLTKSSFVPDTFLSSIVVLATSSLSIVLINMRHRYVTALQLKNQLLRAHASRRSRRSSRSIELLSLHSDGTRVDNDAATINIADSSNRQDETSIDSNFNIATPNAYCRIFLFNIVDITAILGMCILFVNIDTSSALYFVLYSIIGRMLEVVVAIYFILKLNALGYHLLKYQNNNDTLPLNLSAIDARDEPNNDASSVISTISSAKSSASLKLPLNNSTPSSDSHSFFNNNSDGNDIGSRDDNAKAHRKAYYERKCPTSTSSAFLL